MPTEQLYATNSPIVFLSFVCIVFLSIFFSFIKYIQIKKYITENNHNYENVTIALF